MIALALFSLLVAGPAFVPVAGPFASDTVFASCERRASAPVEAWIAMRPARATDTLATVHVCAATRAAATKIGSYNAELLFDSAAARVVSVQKVPGGMRAENATQAGQVRFAGASPDGFAPGAMLTVTMRLARRGRAPAMSLRVHELNTVDGTSLLSSLTNHSAP